MSNEVTKEQVDQTHPKRKYSDKSAYPFRNKHWCEYPRSILRAQQSRLYCEVANCIERMFRKRILAGTLN